MSFQSVGHQMTGMPSLVRCLYVLPLLMAAHVGAMRNPTLAQAEMAGGQQQPWYLFPFVKDTSGGVAVDSDTQQESGALQPCKLSVATPAAPPHAGILAEPHKLTTFVLSLSCKDSEHATSWEFFSEGPNGQMARGAEVAFTYTQRGHGQLKVSACPLDSASAKGCSSEAQTQVFLVPVVVTYVRRNLQTLGAEELQRYFTAIKVMYNHTTEEGRKLFGPDFWSYNELAALHAAAVWVKPGECDFGHHGPALVTFHRTFIRLLERSLQSVDPSLACHYWDYLKDGELADPGSSYIFSNDFFGSMMGDPDNHYMVHDGQFARWQVPMREEAAVLAQMTWGRLGPSHMLNPYGILRSRDNGNASPYLTRFGPLKSRKAATLEDWLTCANRTILGSFIECLDTLSIHPAWHSLVGGTHNVPTFEDLKGTLNCSAFTSMEACSEALSAGITVGGDAREMGVLDGCLTCPAQCASLDQNVEECGCYCEPERKEWCSPMNVALRYYSKIRGTPSALLTKAWEFVDYGFCARGRSTGDYQDGGSAALDPIFSAYHANLDRLVGTWRLQQPQQDWVHLGFTYPSTDNRFYPDFQSAVNILVPGNLYPGVVKPSILTFASTGACEGHGLFDELAGGSFVGVFDCIPSTQPHTNLEILESLDRQLQSPATADYIYDSYEPVTAFPA